MRKITLLFAIFTSALKAQTFPTPYCTINDPDDVTVEEITAVDLNGFVISNSNATSPLVNFTSNSVPVASGQNYPLKVYGNTHGNFDTNIVAFIDWNNNGLLNDPGEIYEIGTLSNSSGDDGIFVEMQILVPATAIAGTTRVRLTKTYTDEESVAIVNPCAISFDAFGFGEVPGYGQALDFNLLVGNLNTSTFDANSLSIYPVPAKDSLNITYKSPISSVLIYNQLGQEVLKSNDLGSEVALNISSLSTGIYVVKLFNDDQSTTFKIIKE